MREIHVIDSHTAGEPTRIVIVGGPDLGNGPLAERVEIFKNQHDRFRSAIVNEPRGSDVIVGGLLVQPIDPTCIAGVIFFNNVGYLGMCGHGTMGLVQTLAYQGLLQPGVHRIETPVGVVTTTLHDDGRVSVENVPSWREKKGIELVDWNPSMLPVKGDIAWGGNWFYLTQLPPHPDLPLDHRITNILSGFANGIRHRLNREHQSVDHIELFGPPQNPGSHSRNFVLCPGGAYDRSPCGTGTSAKLACLAADGKLAEGEEWVQESIIGTTFTGTFRWLDRAAGKIIPTITGRAYITGENKLLLDENDPFCWGIR
ncbi:proline racemase family protein [Anatilimnocola floriformis]|uniref:proline racemase family protein n=1 Tax=Anatilimnocola floriformis TaxID=2948575 RepID=UPI0020C27A6D|nr:proline racemase family protein [Anatilimnocola floriformis]